MVHKPFHVSEHQFSARVVKGAALLCLEMSPSRARLQEAGMTQGEEGTRAPGTFSSSGFLSSHTNETEWDCAGTRSGFKWRHLFYGVLCSNFVGQSTSDVCTGMGKWWSCRASLAVIPQDVSFRPGLPMGALKSAPKCGMVIEGLTEQREESWLFQTESEYSRVPLAS